MADVLYRYHYPEVFQVQPAGVVTFHTHEPVIGLVVLGIHQLQVGLPAIAAFHGQQREGADAAGFRGEIHHLAGVPLAGLEGDGHRHVEDGGIQQQLLQVVAAALGRQPRYPEYLVAGPDMAVEGEQRRTDQCEDGHGKLVGGDFLQTKIQPGLLHLREGVASQIEQVGGQVQGIQQDGDEETEDHAPEAQQANAEIVVPTCGTALAEAGGQVVVGDNKAADQDEEDVEETHGAATPRRLWGTPPSVRQGRQRSRRTVSGRSSRCSGRR